MSTQYDPEILETFADVLYSRAKWMAVSTAIVYALVGGLVSFLAFAAIPRLLPADSALLAMCIIALISFFVGLEAGNKKAFNLRLQAQQVLCQRQIELNTGPKSSSVARGH
jgi:hypothetical protein